jgi:MoaA/NifB/PqqE/SkfB family radical SAM enzyme
MSERAQVSRWQGLARRGLPVVQLGARRLLGRKSPFQMTLSLTNRCNFRCVYCHIPLQHREEMSTDEWLRAIDELAAGGMGRASLIGGEPMVRRDVGPIIRHLKRLGVHTSMNTNGWFVAERIDEVAPLDLACVTLDGPEELHDRQRHPGSYRRAVEAIEVLRRRGVQVVTMTVLTGDGVGTVEHVLGVAREHGVRAFFQIEHHADMDVHLPLAPAISEAQVVSLAERLRALKRAGWPVGNSDATLRAQARRRYLTPCADCHAGSYYGYVFSDGTVAPCLLTAGQAEAGSGRTRGFVRAFDELAAPEGPGCSCVPSHEVNRMLDFDLRVLWSAVELTLDGARA